MEDVHTAAACTNNAYSDALFPYTCTKHSITDGLGEHALLRTDSQSYAPGSELVGEGRETENNGTHITILLLLRTQAKHERMKGKKPPPRKSATNPLALQNFHAAAPVSPFLFPTLSAKGFLFSIWQWREAHHPPPGSGVVVCKSGCCWRCQISLCCLLC